MNQDIHVKDGDSVTLIFSWKVVQGREKDFTEWMQGIAKESLKWPGHMGVTTLSPPDGKGPYHSILRFDNAEHLQEWLDSDTRAKWLDRLQGIATASISRESGMETWFDLPGTIATPLPKWKMVIITFVAVYPCSLLISALVVPHLVTLPLFLRSLVFPLILPVLMTYVLMPFLTQRVFKRWLYKTN